MRKYVGGEFLDLMHEKAHLCLLVLIGDNKTSKQILITIRYNTIS